MGWVSASDYDDGQPDPLADSMAEIIPHMNVDHKDELVMLARRFAHRFDGSDDHQSRSPRLSCPLKNREGMRGARIAFLQEVREATETTKVLGEMVKQACSQAD